MNVLVSTLSEELKTVKRLGAKYGRRLKRLPKGSFVVRVVGSRRYGYVTKRKGGKVTQDYLGSVDERTIEYYRRIKVEKRELKRKLKNLHHQSKVLRRALRGETA